jgi:hypothetical protein
MKPKSQIVRGGPNQFRLVGQKNASCPGYILRSNKQGFIWKQVCACCPRPAAHQYHPSELRAAA